MSAKVSIMMPCYNAADSLLMALASVFAQTHSNWELIAVNDGSTDATGSILDSFTDDRLVVVHFPQNAGRGVARQAALSRATGDYLAFLDADDWMYPDKLARQLALLNKYPNAVAVTAKFAAVNPRTHLAGIGWGLVKPTLHPEIRRFNEVCRPPLNYIATMLRMPVAKQNQYEPELKRAQDMDFILKAARGRDFIADSDVSYAYSGWEMRRGRSLEAAKYERKIYRTYLSTDFRSASRLWARSLCKSAILMMPTGATSRIRRSQSKLTPPSSLEVREFEEALNSVSMTHDMIMKSAQG